MKTKIIFFVICNLIICNLQYSQNITNTLGTSGVFTLKDNATTYLSLNQSSGYLYLNNSFVLPHTINSTTGIVYKGTDRFLHNYGTNNTFLGINSGNFGMTGTNNTAFGVEALKLNTTGYSNTSIGSYNLSANTAGGENTALGWFSLYSNSIGNGNTSVGSQTMISNTSGSNNTALGTASLFSNSTGTNNSALGSQSLFSNTTGSYNIGLGFQSLYSNSIGNNNIALGPLSLFLNTTGALNTAIGLQSLYRNNSGSFNTALGSYSLYNCNSGVNNVAIGYNSLFNNSNGSNNTIVGVNAGNNITIGNNNTVIGYNAEVPYGNSNNQIRIGNQFIDYAGIHVAWTITSDRRWKQNILSSNLGLSFISKLNPVSYSRINDEKQKTEYGFIAQEVEEVLKENGVENSGMLTITDEGMYELRYNDLLAPMVKAIQELKTENDELKEKLSKFENMQNVLAGEIEKIKNSGIKEVNSQTNSPENQ